MGFLDNLLGRKPATINVYMQPAETLSGVTPTYSEHNRLDNIWQCDLAWQCLSRITREVAKVTPAHIVKTPGELYSVNDAIQRVLQHPNPIMTTYDMMSKVLHTLYTRGDAFIFPVYDGTRLCGLYPVIPQTVDWLESNGELYVQLNFSADKKYILPYFAIIHIRLNYSEDDYMGTCNETPLLSNMQLNQDLLDSVKKGVMSSAVINGIVKYGTALSKKAIEADVKAFNEQLKRSESGILGLDNQSEYKDINRNVKLVDADTLKYVQSLVLNHFGMSAKVLDGTASKEEEESWYHATIQPLMECLGQAFSRVLFSETQRNKGHCIRWYSRDRLHWMTGTELTEAVKQLSQVGGVSINEIRDAFGFAPLTEEEGGNTRPMSLNYIDSKYATEYQLESLKTGGKKNEKQTEDE